jgi:hypothetical protein
MDLRTRDSIDIPSSPPAGLSTLLPANERDDVSGMDLRTGDNIDIPSSPPAGLSALLPANERDEGTGMDLRTEDSIELPSADVPSWTDPGSSEIELAEEIVPEEGSASKSGKSGSGRDLIAEELESGKDLLKKKDSLDESAEIDLEEVHAAEESSAVDLGSLAAMPTEDEIRGKTGSESVQELGADIPHEEGSELPVEEEVESADLETVPDSSVALESVDLDVVEREAITEEEIVAEEADLEGEGTPAPVAKGKKAKEIKKAVEKEEETPRPRGRAGAWLASTFVGTLVGGGACVALWVVGFQPPQSLREMAGMAPARTSPAGPGPGTSPGPGAAPAPMLAQVALDHLKRGNFDKVNPAQLDETRPEQLLARAELRWLTYLRQEKGRNPAAQLKIDAEPVRQALVDLNKDLIKATPDAIYLRGQIYEMTGNLDRAREEYAAGLKQFQADPDNKERFEAALTALSFRTGRASNDQPGFRRDRQLVAGPMRPFGR